jgi:hypothetical protein
LAKATAKTQGRKEIVLNILNDCMEDERKTVDDGQSCRTDDGLLIHQSMLGWSYIASQAVTIHVAVGLLPCWQMSLETSIKNMWCRKFLRSKRVSFLQGGPDFPACSLPVLMVVCCAMSGTSRSTALDPCWGTVGLTEQNIVMHVWDESKKLCDAGKQEMAGKG